MPSGRSVNCHSTGLCLKLGCIVIAGERGVSFGERERGAAPVADPDTPESPTWRMMMAGPVVAAVTLLAALLATHDVGVPFRDPDHVVGKRLALVACGVALLVVLDVVVRAGWRSRKIAPSRAAIRSVQRERWSRRRGAAVAIALVSFYVTYLAYRNLKSIVPLLRPEDNFDVQLADFERGLFGGNDPADLLHTLLGTGVAAEILSIIYVAFIALVPVSLAIALVFSPTCRAASSTPPRCRSTGASAS